MMDSRAAFEAAHTHLDLATEKDAWGRDRYKHQCVDAMWSGWQAATERAAKVCNDAAARLFAGKSRVNQVDRHTAQVLNDKAAAIRG